MKIGQIGFAFIVLLFAAGVSVSQTNDVLIEKARVAIEKRDYTSAMTDLNAVLKRQPANEAALTLRARVYVRQNKFAESWADAAKVLARNPNNYEALNVRGVIKRERDGDLKGALDDFLKVAALKPDFYLGLLNIGLTNRQLGKMTEALAAFDQAIKLEPANQVGYELRAVTFTVMWRWKDALTDLDKAISIDGNNGYYYSMRAYSRLRLFLNNAESDTTNARNDAEKALQLDAKNALALAVRALIRVNANDAVGGLADAESALQLAPRSALALVARGFVRSSKKDFDGALADIDAAYQTAPNDKWLAELRVRFSRGLDTPAGKAVRDDIAAKSMQAVEKAKQRVAAEPREFAAYDALSEAFRAANVEWTVPREYWQKLVNEDANNICAMRFLAEYKAKDYREMIDYLDAGLRRYDGKTGSECAAEIAFRIGRELESRNNNAQAMSYFEKARSIKSDLKYLDGNIALAESKIAAAKAADAELQRAFDATNRAVKAGTYDNPTPKTFTTKSKIVDPGKTRAAIEDYDRVHSVIESDLRVLQNALDKYAAAGFYRQFYKGTYDRINATISRMHKSINDLLKRQGDFLPQQLIDHLEADQQKLYGLNIPSPYQ